MRLALERYKGFVLTAYTFSVEGLRRGQARWTVGVFVRTEEQPVQDNKYFCRKGVLIRTGTGRRGVLSVWEAVGRS